jgi:hypothetical protein
MSLCAPFRMTDLEPKLKDLLYLMLGCLSHAVAECTLDDALGVLPEPSRQFADLNRCFSKAKTDTALARYLTAARRIRRGYMPDAPRDWLQEGAESAKATRSLIMGWKQVLLEKARPRCSPWMLGDAQNTQLKIAIEAEMYKDFPELPQIRMMTGYIGAAMTANLDGFRTGAVCATRMVTAEAAPGLVLELQERADIYSTAIVTLKNPDDDNYENGIVQVAQSSAGVLTSYSDTQKFQCTRNQLLELDRQFAETNFFWLTVLLPTGASFEQPRDWEFLKSLRASLYFHAIHFDTNWLRPLITLLGDKVELAVTSVPCRDAKSLDVLLISRKNIRFFWFLSGIVNERSRRDGWVELDGLSFNLMETAAAEKGLLAAGNLVLAGL